MHELDVRLLDQDADWHVPPGACMAVQVADARHVACEGLARLQPSEPMTVGHWHDLASVSKLVTTLTLCVLVRAGLVEWQTTLADVLGGRAGKYGSVTVDQLLRHRGGFRPWKPLYLEAGAGVAGFDPIASILADEPASAPDTETVYSDLGMQVAAAVIEELTGTPYPDAVRSVLGPEFRREVTDERAGVPSPCAASSVGDAIEREMVATGVPYAVDADGDGFAWRTEVIQGETNDCNAHHAYGSAAGHAGWFSTAEGLLSLGELLLEIAEELAEEPVNGIGRGVRVYDIEWDGCRRTLVGHPGFTGTFVGVSPAIDEQPALVVAWLSNRLHDAEPVAASRLAPVDQLWRAGLAAFDARLNSNSGGTA
ncbi:MAG: serine hydrolase domain-containing protein [Agrococcus casei]|uniref:serine hydrolase domain-containing protein n=1 Tax=Agrococcus casei TaxID=343512 RepID=UPI003F8E2CBC